jgi:hypothetical protein
VRSRFHCVNRCAFLASSHSGWWRLKSPIHIVCRGPIVRTCVSRSRMKLDKCVSAWLLLPSLYMLMILSVPKWPCSSIAVMSGCWICICFHESVSRWALTRVMDLVLSGCSWCVLGYTMIQFRFARDLPLKSMYGSCIVHKSYSSRLRLSSKSSWLMRDLLTFCCRICSGLHAVS